MAGDVPCGRVQRPTVPVDEVFEDSRLVEVPPDGSTSTFISSVPSTPTASSRDGGKDLPDEAVDDIFILIAFFELNLLVVPA